MTRRRRQPPAGKVYLDHVAWFVRSLDEATEVFERLGFTLTPYAVHGQSDGEAEDPAPTGTANRCAILEQGYLELLGTVGDSDLPLARQHRAALDRYEGIHLIAFATADPEAAHALLVSGGFEPLEPARLRRPMPGPPFPGGVLGFTVVRVPPGKMPEGRIQMIRHETPELLWRSDLTAHDNGVSDLAGVLICVEDPEGAASRYGRFLGVPWIGRADQTAVVLDHGRIDFVTRARCRALLPRLRPVDRPPRIVAAYLRVPDVAGARRFFMRRRIALVLEGVGFFCIDPGEALGTTLVIGSPTTTWPLRP